MNSSSASPEIDLGVEHQLEVQGPKGPGSLLNSKSLVIVEGGSEGAGVSLVPEREITLPAVKAPKYWLSQEGSFQPQTVGMLA